MPRPNPNLLLVEGVDDQHVVYALCKRHALPECFEVVPPKGVQRLLQAVPERLQESDRQRVGLVLDADTDVKARWTSVRNLLIRVGYDPPLHPDPAGTVIASPDPLFAPTVGIWLMPDNQAAGTLEDFLERLVPERDALFTRARHAVAAIPPQERRFSEPRLRKAELHTWLAWQEEPGQPFGTSITARVLDGDRPQAREFIGWLRRLYEIGGGSSQ